MEKKDLLVLMELVQKYGTKKIVDHVDRLSPAFKEISKWQVPYVKYFETIPYQIWSKYHYSTWLCNTNNNNNIRAAYTTFYKALRIINVCKVTSTELRQITNILLKEKEVSDKENKQRTDVKNTVSNKKRKNNPISQASSIDSNSSHSDSTVESTNNINTLKQKLLSFFKSRSSYSLLNANEAVLQAVMELLLPNDKIPELCLLMDNTKPRGDGRFGFVDMMFGDAIIELKYVNILGLIKAIKNDWNVSPCTNDLANFDKCIENEDENKLLERNFMFWSKEQNRPKIIKLNEILLSAEEQVTRYMNVIVNGPVQNGQPGIIDSRTIIKWPWSFELLCNYGHWVSTSRFQVRWITKYTL
ncbi:39191_t:CDS:2 [Gigaspora margarita]|uniref:39191_t:CDS:1 n=1 Tax=Gigaspora margarita TaxID=4874 RepID=A0ABN7VNS8_GIGMA|nr:39191_t:CDS:2 [Gigaspora margarita]